MISVLGLRLSTVRHADLILVLEKGSVVEVGTHNQLLEVEGAYSGLVNAQVSSFSHSPVQCHLPLQLTEGEEELGGVVRSPEAPPSPTSPFSPISTS